MRALAWLAALACIGAAFGLLAACPARAHLKGCEGECQQWMMSLQNGRGTFCCDFNEATDLDDANWDTAVIDGVDHYRVRINGEWLAVDADSVVKPPINRLGRALAWLTYLDGKPWVKCFLPGAGA